MYKPTFMYIPFLPQGYVGLTRLDVLDMCIIDSFITWWIIPLSYPLLFNLGLDILSYFLLTIGFDISSKWSPKDNLHEMPKPTVTNKKKNVTKCRLLKFLPSMLSVNPCPDE